MSTQFLPRMALCALACASTYSIALPNDLLLNEQWGLNNVPRTSFNTPASADPAAYSSMGTCDTKPDITNNQYSCTTFTSSGVEDIDINAPEGWAVYNPLYSLAQNEVVIALIDTGIDYNHPDLKNKVWLNPGEALGIDSNSNGIDDGCEDNIDGDHNGYLNDCHGINAMVNQANTDGTLNPVAGDPIDDTVGHGTNMAGVMAATANNHDNAYHGGIVGVTGLESHIKIATCKSATLVEDAFPYVPGVVVPVATETAIRSCLSYFLDLKQRGVNIVVINASGGLSHSINIGNVFYPTSNSIYLLNTPAMTQLATDLENADIAVVAAAGNFSWDIDRLPTETAYYPAAFPNENIISVGAINNQGELWSGSSWGRWSVDVFAPGESILSTFPGYPLVAPEDSDFVVTDGSSQATAYVSGMVALIRANTATANLDAKAIRRLILASGKPLASAKNKSVAGSLVRLADSNGRGVLTCNQQIFKRRQQPQSSSIVALADSTITLEVQNFNCAQPGSEISLSAVVTPTNEVITLLDDGTGADRVAGDGIYSANWTVPHGDYEFTINTGWDSVSGTDDIIRIKAGIILDNDNAGTGYVGKWWPSIYRPGYYGSLYRYATNAEPEKIYTWSPTIPVAGYYRAYARWPQGPNFASNATYRIHHQNPSTGITQVSEVAVNQRENGNQWRELGVYWFEAGNRTLQLTNVNADGTCVADAIQLVPEQ